ncbi:uncharacterized protein LOC111054395 [Nilaparvata lugens]|nr:uncharacterized protein LOC111054395 [Nilaparvata lugens]
MDATTFLPVNPEIEADRPSRTASTPTMTTCTSNLDEENSRDCNFLESCSSIEIEHSYSSSPNKTCKNNNIDIMEEIMKEPGTGNCQIVINKNNDVIVEESIKESETACDQISSFLPQETNINLCDEEYGSNDEAAADDPDYVVSEQSSLDDIIDVNQEELIENNALGRFINKRNRKGQAKREEWFDSKNKKLREQGKQYTGWKKEESGKSKRGKERKSRKLGPRCQGRGCQRSGRTCNEVSNDERETIFRDFWTNLSWGQKKTYIASLVSCGMKKSVKNPGAASRRKSTLTYTVKTTNGVVHKVCKPFFLNTFALGEWTVKNWAADSTNAAQGHAITPAKVARPRRGLGENNPRAAAKLNEFLDNMPKLPAHYCRRDSSKLYIEPVFGNRMADVYAEYKRQCENDEEPIKPLSTCTFYKIIHSKKLSFQQPKKDRCDFCVAKDAGLISEEDYIEHVKLKDRARQEKADDKLKADEGSLFVISQDVQAVKVCPSLNASALYFKTKLVCHNFSIYEMKSHFAKSFWFNETQADLSASTFASCVIDFLENRWNKDEKTPIVIWSDGCTSQNRNVIMANALLSFSKEHDVEIQQKFLEKGHTQMEVDSIHAMIENKINNQPIHLPSDYIRLAACARSNPSPIEQKELTYDFVKNFAKADLLMYDSIRPGRKPGDPVVTDIRVIRYKDGEISVKTKSFDNEFLAIPQRKRRNTVAKLAQFKQLHKEPLKITKTKWTHLQQLKSVIPTDCHPFYDTIAYE